MDNSPVIKTTDLTYHFNKHQNTLHDISLQVERGSICGFLGPNGAGKITTLRLLLGLVKKQQGSMKSWGKNLRITE